LGDEEAIDFLPTLLLKWQLLELDKKEVELDEERDKTGLFNLVIGTLCCFLVIIR
jgi:hypothetical protein